MDKHEPEVWLSALRPDTDDFKDPGLKEVLDEVRADPDLSQWLDAQIEFDRAFAAKLQESTLPDDMLVRPPSSPPRQKRFLRHFAMAASLLVLLGLIGHFNWSALYNARMHTFSTFQTSVAYFAAGAHFELDYMDQDLTNLQLWLEDHDLLAGDHLSEALLQAPGMGCKKVRWKKSTASLLCLVNQEGKVVHVFMVEADLLGEDQLASLRSPRRLYGLETAGWQAHGVAYVLVGSEPDVSILEYLPAEGVAQSESTVGLRPIIGRLASASSPLSALGQHPKKHSELHSF